MSQKIEKLILVDFPEDNSGIPLLKEYHYVEKKWGSERWVVNNDKYCMKILKIEKGERCSVHYHKNKDEVFFITKGTLQVELWHKVDLVSFNEKKPDHMMKLWTGASIRIVPGTAHRFTGLENTTFMEVSTTHKEEDSIRLIHS